MRYVVLAIGAAVLYALSTPFSKLLMQAGVDSTVLAGLLYLGAGFGMSVVLLMQKRQGSATEKSLRKDDAPYAIAMVLLDVAAPAFLLWGLASCEADSVSLMNNFEIVATALIAMVLFREKVGPKLWAAIAFITAACILLSLGEGGSFSIGLGSLAVLGACVCWGVENNCTNRISDRNPIQIVCIKGLGSGFGALVIGLFIGGALPVWFLVFFALGLGFLAYGLSICLYIYAQRGLGAARTSAYYAVAPFAGVAISWAIYGVNPSPYFIVALVLMLVGSFLALPKKIDI